MTYTARRRMLAGTAAGLLTASLGVALSSTATAAPARTTASACAISTLPYPTDTYRAEADAIDPSGRFVVGSALRVLDTGNQYVLLFWDGQQLTETEMPGSNGVSPVDVNESGIVIGNGWAENGMGRPWTYRDGQFEQLPVLSSTYTVVTAINSAGDIVGYGTDIVPGEYSALRWPAARPGTVEVLDAPLNAQPVGVTANGTIVGYAGTIGDWTGWVRRPNGKVKPLAVPGGGSTTVSAAAGRWAVGDVWLDGSTPAKVRWDLRNGSYTFLDQEVWPDDVNAKGVVIGGDRVARGGTSQVLPGGGTRINIGARSIADTGDIVGFRNADRVTPVRWTGC